MKKCDFFHLVCYNVKEQMIIQRIVSFADLK